jgi:hypothetical protein
MRELGNKEVVLIMANILMVVNKDRHQFLRTEVKWPATIIPSSRPTPAEIKSISQVGASICLLSTDTASRAKDSP